AARYRGLLLACVLSVTAALTCACTEQKTSGAAASSQADTTSANSAQTLVPAAFPADNSPLPSITANRAFQYTKEIAAFGPRPIGSANHKKLEEYIHAHLKGDDVEEDSFTADTP